MFFFFCARSGGLTAAQLLHVVQIHVYGSFFPPERSEQYTLWLFIKQSLGPQGHCKEVLLDSSVVLGGGVSARLATTYSVKPFVLYHRFIMSQFLPVG